MTPFPVVGGHGQQSQQLQTSGTNLGANGNYDGNDSTVLRFSNLKADPFGGLHVDVRLVQGSYAYLGLIRLESRDPRRVLSL